METVATFKVKETENSNFVLLKTVSENNNTFWVMFCERNGLEMRDTRVVKERLDKETKEFFNVK